MWPFSTIKKLQTEWSATLVDLEKSVTNFNKMYQVSCDQGAQIDRLMNELEIERMKLVACGIGAMANTREAAHNQRVTKENPYYCASVGDVYDAVDREIRLREALDEALDVIGEIVKTKLNGDMRDNGQKAERFLSKHRGTKVCLKCGSDMVKIESEDKKLCSNGGCGYEVAWELAPGQKYQHKNNVEPFVEDRSQPEEPRTQTRY